MKWIICVIVMIFAIIGFLRTIYAYKELYEDKKDKDMRKFYDD